MRKISVDTEREAYLPGDAVRGKVRLSTDQPLRARAILLDVLGKEETRVTVQRGKSSYTYVSTNIIIRGEDLLLKPSVDEVLELQPGDYEFPFEFYVPANALPSYAGRCAKVSYNLTARVDVPLWLDVKDEREIFVFRSRDALEKLAQPAFFQSENYEPLTGEKPAFRVNLPRKGFVAGEFIEGTVTIRSKSSARVRKVRVVLKSQEHAVAQGYPSTQTPREHKWDIPADDIAEGVPKPFTLPIPADAPSSYEGTYSSYRWALEFDLDLAFAFDINALFPVEILR